VPVVKPFSMNRFTVAHEGTICFIVAERGHVMIFKFTMKIHYHMVVDDLPFLR
jgi:hypothetical protein